MIAARAPASDDRARRSPRARPRQGAAPLPNDFHAAISICQRICGHITCNSMENLGGR
jgi:hypothetical protein